MQRTLGLVLVALAAGACGTAKPSAGGTAVQGPRLSRAIVDPYLKIGAALASDSVDGVKEHAGELATASSSLGAFAVKIDTAALQLASAADLADARTKFAVLSESIDAYMTSQHLSPPEGVRVAFCPMKLKPWMQADGRILNPYYGSEMPGCGSFRN